jgi:hypothetical protein
MAFLAELATDNATQLADGALRLDVDMTVQSIGWAVGLGREQTSRLLHVLEMQGVVLRRKGWLILPSDSPINPSGHADARRATYVTDSGQRSSKNMTHDAASDRR